MKASEESLVINYTQTKTHEINHELLRERRVVSLEKYGAEAETFKLLRTKVLKQLRVNNWNSVGITGPTQGVGKTMVSVNLAIAMAREVNQTVLLVDLDLRVPRIQWYFDVEVEKGLSDCLMQNIPISEVLINPSIERLVILPGRGRSESSSELLSGPLMRQIVEEIKQRYQSRIIIFDLPPILASDDVLACMDFFDAALLVVAEGESKPEDVTKSLHMLSGSNLLGMVLNKAENIPDHIGYY
ncbi:exopolysaccharide biosynthesis protein [Methyloprofundus sedimenti]|uniref:non-specific protein-tyrosine kinase n=1 Tax=Methyloprofundus sedimenti TaxID=1420851 RepID=A0A1V8MBH1_9GAMM|nr:exopolysaccharide biosynthesis protein [Methyloprofundus sedimenti]